MYLDSLKETPLNEDLKTQGSSVPFFRRRTLQVVSDIDVWLYTTIFKCSYWCAWIIQVYGDADGDGRVNVQDVTAIQSHLAELKTVEGIYLRAADANQDDIVDISDATAIQMKLAEYELPYPIGQYITKEIVSE